MYFHGFVIISPWKMMSSSTGTNLYIFILGRFLPGFCWIWANGSGEDVFLKVNNVFSLFYYHLRFEKDGVLRLNILHKIWKFSCPKMLWAKFGWNRHAKWYRREKNFEMWKVYHDDRLRTNFNQKSLLQPHLLRWAKEYLQLRPFWWCQSAWEWVYTQWRHQPCNIDSIIY